MNTLKITHILPDLLNLYGDKGNIKTLAYRALKRGVEVTVTEIREQDALDLSDTDILLLGGGTDTEQKKALDKLYAEKEQITEYVEKDGVLLALCGGFEMLGTSLAFLPFPPKKKNHDF